MPKNDGGMRFHDLEKFSIAMVGKKVWKLVQDTNSLFYRVFKTKYFSNRTIFYAKAHQVLMPGKVS